MRRIFIALIFILSLALPLSAQEEEPGSEELNACEGTWILHYDTKWSMKRVDDGLTILIPSNATIYDCGRQQGTLQEYMNNVMAIVRCSNSSEQKGDLHVEAIQITCE